MMSAIRRTPRSFPTTISEAPGFIPKRKWRTASAQALGTQHDLWVRKTNRVGYRAPAFDGDSGRCHGGDF